MRSVDPTVGHLARDIGEDRAIFGSGSGGGKGRRAGVSVRVLIDADTVQNRVAQMAAKLAGDYSTSPPVVVGILNGAVRFMMDLLYCMPADFSQFVD